MRNSPFKIDIKNSYLNYLTSLWACNRMIGLRQILVLQGENN